MFYNKYSDYSPEQIKTEKYLAFCHELLNMAKNDKVKKQMESILYEGGYGDFSFNTGLTRNNEIIERKRRIGYAYILATNPETLDILMQNNINLFHGTNANALPSILKYGMQSVDEQASKGIDTLTGEKWSRIEGKRNYISFTDDIDTALDYASLRPECDKFTQESFGVIIGISLSSLRQLKTCRIQSDLPEIGIMDNVPLEHIKTIAVPEDKVEFVRKLVDDNEIIVIPVSIDKKFYYISDWGKIFFDAEKAKQLAKQGIGSNFNSKELAKLSKTRIASKIHSMYEKIRKIIENRGKEDGKENEKNTRDK